MTVQMTILGLGQIGASIGLALDKYKNEIVRVGHDREPTRTKQAQKAGALDKTSLNLPASVENADIVVLALPLDEVRQTLEVIAPVLKEGCTIIDTSPNKVGIAAWIKELIPEERFYVTMAPSLNPAYLPESEADSKEPHADLFHSSLMSISSLPGTHADAIRLATDITSLLGAQPYFADPYEVDGLIASGDLLPKLSAAALVHVAAGQLSWREGQKLAGRAFYDATQPLTMLDEDRQLGAALLLNAENSARVIDQMIAALQEARKLITNHDEQGLHGFLSDARKRRSDWWWNRQKADWGQVIERPEMPSAGEVFGRMFGLRRRSKDKK